MDISALVRLTVVSASIVFLTKCRFFLDSGQLVVTLYLLPRFIEHRILHNVCINPGRLGLGSKGIGGSLSVTGGVQSVTEYPVRDWRHPVRDWWCPVRDSPFTVDNPTLQLAANPH